VVETFTIGEFWRPREIHSRFLCEQLPLVMQL
jgi:hypothetical protein